MEVQPWESIGLDDDTHLTSSSSSSFSLLRRCSRLSKPSSPPPPESPRFRRIPGPASAIQAAMHRKDHCSLPLNPSPDSELNGGLIEISTQEYIRRVEQDSDEEFARDSWISAIQSLRRDGLFTPTSLKDINNCFNLQRFHTVIAVVKSCTPNGLGDMILTLKDPTDTIGATVHRKVLSIGEFGRLITAGSILVLQKVVAFPSSCDSCYLNITRKNVVKVISVDCEVQYFQDTNLTDAQAIEKADDRMNSTPAGILSRSKHMESSAYKISKEPILSDLHLADSGNRASRMLGQYPENTGKAAQLGSEAVVAVANCEEDHARDVSSTPSISENHASRYAWQQHAPELNRMLTGKRQNRLQNSDSRTLSSSKNLTQLDRCAPSDAQKHGSQSGINSDPSVAVNLVEQETANPNDGKKWTQMRDIQSSNDMKQGDRENTGPGGLKKQRTGLISNSSVHEWTDEQLCVLEMDDD